MLSSNQIKEKLINDNGLLIKILEDYGFCDVWIDNKLEYLRLSNQSREVILSQQIQCPFRQHL